MNEQEAIDAIRTCPECGKTEPTYAWQRVSDPASRRDGTYGVCSECKVHWPLSPTWINPEAIAKDFAQAKKISDEILKHSREVPYPKTLDKLKEV
jgi:hypothetical protein